MSSTSSPKCESWEDIERQGWCYVRNALSPTVVQRFREQVWGAIPSAFPGASEDNPETWPTASSKLGRGSLFLPSTSKGALTAITTTNTTRPSKTTTNPTNTKLDKRSIPNQEAKTTMDLPKLLQPDMSHWDNLLTEPKLRAAINAHTSSIGYKDWACPANVGRTDSHHWYPIAFPDPTASAADPCDGTGSPNIGWHVDMSRYSWGFLDGSFRWTPVGTPLIGDAHRPLCILLYLLSDCGPGEGGTLLVPGSHLWVKQKVDEMHSAGGISHADLNKFCIQTVNVKLKKNQLVHNQNTNLDVQSSDSNENTIHQVVGKAGDVVIMHAWCVHSGSRNKFGKYPRIMGNAHVHAAPMFTLDALVAAGWVPPNDETLKLVLAQQLIPAHKLYFENLNKKKKMKKKSPTRAPPK